MNQYTYTMRPGKDHRFIPEYEVVLLLQWSETGSELYNIIAENVRIDSRLEAATATDSIIDKLSEMGYELEDGIDGEDSCLWRIEINQRHAAQILVMVTAELLAQGATIKEVIRIE